MKIDRIWEAPTQQRLFRSMVEATSKPGQRQSLQWLGERTRLTPKYLALTVIAVLVDTQVTLADTHKMLMPSDWSLLQCSEDNPETANYILGPGFIEPNFTPAIGDLSNPDRSATLILTVESLSGAEIKLDLQGPGIKENQILGINGLNADWISSRQQWVSDFPLGVDIYLVDDKSVVALPRSTRAEEI